MNKSIIAAVAVSAMLVSGCSSRPREFNAQLAAPPQDLAAFEASEAQCRNMAVNGGATGSGTLGSAGTGIAVGAGAAAVGSAATSGTYATMSGAMAAGSAAAMAVPVFGIGAAWLMARTMRAKKEGRIKQATADCLAQDGYVVAGWNRTGRKIQPREETAVAQAD